MIPWLLKKGREEMQSFSTCLASGLMSFLKNVLTIFAAIPQQDVCEGGCALIPIMERSLKITFDIHILQLIC